EKGKALATVVLNMDTDVEALDREIERLNDRKRAIKARQDSMKEYLRENMEAAGIKKISCPLFSITCVEGREIAVIDDEKLIPDDFTEVKTEIKPKKVDIARALKEGKKVPGAHLERAKSSIRIK
ncbi:siphovirus Gp157 family protein, partial [Pseudomonas aeruginosa]